MALATAPVANATRKPDAPRVTRAAIEDRWEQASMTWDRGNGTTGPEPSDLCTRMWHAIEDLAAALLGYPDDGTAFDLRDQGEEALRQALIDGAVRILNGVPESAES